MSKYEQLKNIMIEANPNLWKAGNRIYRKIDDRVYKNTEITLCDVFIAMGDDIEFFKEKNYLIFRKCIGDNSFEELCKWKLKENLDNQSQPTKDFLTKLLVK